MNLFRLTVLALILTAAGLMAGCTQESQNRIGRSIQNWTGTDGVLEIYAGDKLVKRFLKIDKLTTATGGDDARPYRFGYGVLEENLNGAADANEGLLRVQRLFDLFIFSTRVHTRWHSSGCAGFAPLTICFTSASVTSHECLEESP